MKKEKEEITFLKTTIEIKNNDIETMRGQYKALENEVEENKKEIDDLKQLLKESLIKLEDVRFSYTRKQQRNQQP